MAENKDEQLTDEELAQLQLAEENENAVDRLVQELGCPTRRIRQFAARVLHLLAERDPQRVVPCVPALIEAHFPASTHRAISGHSMGGHGALTLALKYPGRYASVSAFAPIVAPSQVPWGEKAFTAYLGTDRSAWQAHDAVALVAQERAERLPLLIDQGLADDFLAAQLRPELLEAACQAAGHPLTLRRHAGYDHSYYFIASFIGDHLAHHAQALGA